MINRLSWPILALLWPNFWLDSTGNLMRRKNSSGQKKWLWLNNSCSVKKCSLTGPLRTKRVVFGLFWLSEWSSLYYCFLFGLSRWRLSLFISPSICLYFWWVFFLVNLNWKNDLEINELTEVDWIYCIEDLLVSHSQNIRLGVLDSSRNIRERKLKIYIF